MKQRRRCAAGKGERGEGLRGEQGGDGEMNVYICAWACVQGRAAMAGYRMGGGSPKVETVN